MTTDNSQSRHPGANRPAPDADRPAPPTFTVEGVVRQIAEPWRANLVEQFKRHYESVVENYVADCAQNPAACADPSFLYPVNGNMSRKEYQRQKSKSARIHKLDVLVSEPIPEAYLNYRKPQHRYALKSNWPAIIAPLAVRDANEAVAGFIYKITGKLTGIIDAGEGVKEVTVTGQLADSSIRFTLNNGMSFRVQNAIVWHCNDYGTIYVQYPTTFHDVVGFGKTMQLPSEKKLKEFMGVKDAPVELPPDVCPGSGQPFGPSTNARSRYRPCPVCWTYLSAIRRSGQFLHAVPRHNKPKVKT